MLVSLVVVGEDSEQLPEPQPTPSTTPLEVADEAINEEMFDSVERAATTASSLEAEQASHNVNKTQFTATLNEPFFLELGSGGHTLRSGEDNMEHQIKLTDNVPNIPYDSPLPGVNIPRSDEGSLELNELMDLVTKLSHRVFDLEKVKTAQAKEIAGLKRRVTKVEQRQRSRILKNHLFRFGSPRRQSLGKNDVSKQGRKHLKTQLQFREDAFDDIDDLVDKGMAFFQGKDAEIQGKIGVDDTEVVKGKIDANDTKVVKGSGDTEVFDTKKAVSTAGEETKSVEKTKKKVQGDAQMERDVEVALRLQAELDEELRVERERQEEAFKVTIAKMFDKVQARIDADYELAARMTQEEQ
ncbi:hypothetical protein Tco_0934870 [Tanacetum coccineum]